jgi:hypothetical protein
MNPLQLAVALRAKNRCEYCHAPGAIFNCRLEVEHIVPKSKNGEDDIDNFALSCRACNAAKYDHLVGTDPISGKTVRLFHPRRQKWERHFRFDSTTGEIQGRTQAGRATVVRLDMNNPLQIAARQHWVALALFP